MTRTTRLAIRACFFLSTLWASLCFAELANTIERVKPAVVAIGTFLKTQSPPFVFRGTGFAIANGNLIATNAHVLPETPTPDSPELAVLIRSTRGDSNIRRARIVKKDSDHDLAIIQIDGPPLPTLSIGDSATVREGQGIAFTGFPIGGSLGFSPVTHRGIISAITPIALPGANSHQLNEKLITQIRRGIFDVFQLDATAYPGNSGSPVFDETTGIVIGVVNMVFIKGSRESALSAPSGISYAIPAKYLQNLLNTQ